MYKNILPRIFIFLNAKEKFIYSGLNKNCYNICRATRGRQLHLINFLNQHIDYCKRKEEEYEIKSINSGADKKIQLLPRSVQNDTDFLILYMLYQCELSNIYVCSPEEISNMKGNRVVLACHADRYQGSVDPVLSYGKTLYQFVRESSDLKILYKKINLNKPASYHFCTIQWRDSAMMIFNCFFNSVTLKLKESIERDIAEIFLARLLENEKRNEKITNVLDKFFNSFYPCQEAEELFWKSLKQNIMA